MGCFFLITYVIKDIAKIEDIKTKKRQGTGLPVPSSRVVEARKRAACETEIRKPGVSANKIALIKESVKCIENSLSMGGKKMKRVTTVEDLSASDRRGEPGKKSCVARNNKQAATECEGAVVGMKKTNSLKATSSDEREKEERATAPNEMIEEFECDEPMEREEESEGETFLDGEKEFSGKTCSSMSSDVPDEEKVRNQTRERNLKKNKMIRTRHGMRYVEDLSENDKKYLDRREDTYKHTHIGLKVVEASLISSAREGNNESNKTVILRYVYKQGYRVSEVKTSGFGRVDLVFDSIHEANRCLNDKGEGGGDGKYINFSIPSRSRKCKGIITGWDKKATLDELVSAMEDTCGLLELERVKKRVFDKGAGVRREEVSSIISIVWEGNYIPSEVKI